MCVFRPLFHCLFFSCTRTQSLNAKYIKKREERIRRERKEREKEASCGAAADGCRRLYTANSCNLLGKEEGEEEEEEEEIWAYDAKRGGAIAKVFACQAWAQ